MNTEYHTMSQCPETAEYITPMCTYAPEPGLVCKKCLHYGDIKKPVARRLITAEGVEDTSEWKIVKPCTVCAMANQGFWGWEEGHVGDTDFRAPENGVLPGRCGVRDVLNHHRVSEPTQKGVLNEQVILGFVQYALYNHLKWKDILTINRKTLAGTREVVTPYQRKYCATDTTNIGDPSESDEAWYWWKMIPRGVVLSEMLSKKLMSLLVDFPDQQKPGCVPKTCQPIDGEVSDDIWGSFWDTYVEPLHVSHIFTATIESVLTYDDSLEWTKERIYHGDILVGMVCPSDVEWIQDCLFPKERGEWLDFYSYTEQSEDPSDTGMKRFYRILDRDIFGTYFPEVVLYRPRVWLRRHDIRSHPDRMMRRTHRIAEMWGLDELDGVNEDLRETSWEASWKALERIGYEETDYWEEIIRISDDIIDSDYSNERSFREYLAMEEGRDNVIAWAEVGNFDEYITEEWPPNQEETLVDVETESNMLVEKLKELQTLVDEKVKDCVPEGVYLELMNNMCEMYKITNQINSV